MPCILRGTMAVKPLSSDLSHLTPENNDKLTVAADSVSRINNALASLNCVSDQ